MGRTLYTYTWTYIIKTYLGRDTRPFQSLDNTVGVNIEIDAEQICISCKLPLFLLRAYQENRRKLSRKIQGIPIDGCVGSGNKQVISYYGNRRGEGGAVKSSRRGNVMICTKKAATLGLSVLEWSRAVLHYTTILL